MCLAWGGAVLRESELHCLGVWASWILAGLLRGTRLLWLRCDHPQAQRVSIKKAVITRSFRKGVLTNMVKLSRQP